MLRQDLLFVTVLSEYTSIFIASGMLQSLNIPLWVDSHWNFLFKQPNILSLLLYIYIYIFILVLKKKESKEPSLLFLIFYLFVKEENT